ncbi:MAG TPA: GreA/GreB family elongation factor [Burkholderiaceae bacterium]|nr:GreA/GreB family elongation factor [Burkholderiaceae bacterium]
MNTNPLVSNTNPVAGPAPLAGQARDPLAGSARAFAGELLIRAGDAGELRRLLDTLEHLNRTDRAAEAMDELLESARIVEDRLLPEDIVTLDTLVEYRELPSGTTRAITLVLPHLADAAQGRVSVLSPVGRALLGRKPGQQSEAVLANEKRLRLDILTVGGQVAD